MAKSVGTPPNPTVSPAGPAAGARVDVAAFAKVEARTGGRGRESEFRFIS